MESYDQQFKNPHWILHAKMLSIVCRKLILIDLPPLWSWCDGIWNLYWLSYEQNLRVFLVKYKTYEDLRRNLITPDNVISPDNQIIP